MTNTTRITPDTIMGYIALLHVLIILVLYSPIAELKITIRIALIIGTILCTVYGIIKLAQPLAEEVNETGQLL